MSKSYPSIQIVDITKASLVKEGYANLAEWLKVPGHLYIGPSQYSINKSDKYHFVGQSEYYFPYQRWCFPYGSLELIYENYLHTLGDIDLSKYTHIGYYAHEGQPCWPEILIRVANEGPSEQYKQLLACRKNPILACRDTRLVI